MGGGVWGVVNLVQKFPNDVKRRNKGTKEPNVALCWMTSVLAVSTVTAGGLETLQ